MRTVQYRNLHCLEGLATWSIVAIYGQHDIFNCVYVLLENNSYIEKLPFIDEAAKIL